MLHPIFTTALRNPALIFDHLANYGAVIKDECGNAVRGLVARVIAFVVAVVAIALALGWAGVAVMLGYVTNGFHWSLVAVPGGAALIALACAWFAARPLVFHGFNDVRAQIEADRIAMHMAGADDGR